MTRQATKEQRAARVHLEPYARNSSTYSNHGCRCPDCTADASRVSTANTKALRARSPAARRRMNAARDRRFIVKNAELAAAATRHSDEWTPHDVAVARDRRLSAAAAAEKLGRSINSIKHMRRSTNRKANALARRYQGLDQLVGTRLPLRPECLDSGSRR